MKTELLLGYGCGNLHQNPLVGSAWREKFNFNVLPPRSMREYALSWDKKGEEIVAHSQGCITALELLVHNKHIQKAVLLCPAPLPGQFFPFYIQMAMVKFAMQYPREFAKMIAGKDFSPSGENWGKMILNGLSLEEIMVSMEYRTLWHGYHVQQAIMSALANLVGLSKFNFDALKKKEIVCVGCELDQMTRPTLTRGIAKKLGARHVEIPNTGHMLMLGQDANLNLKLLHHLDVL